MLTRLLQSFRRSALTPIQVAGDKAAGRAIVDAIAGNVTDPAAIDLIERIEAIRKSLSVSKRTLESWRRPWLSSSSELLERMYLSAADEHHEIAMTEAEAVKASKPIAWCKALLSLTIMAKPEHVLEMGTNVGISGLYIAAGLEMNARGQLISLEGSPSKSELARANFDKVGLRRATVVTGDFTDTLESALAHLAPLDMAFIDGFHDGQATVRYHDLCKRRASPGAIFIYDDIGWSPGMKAGWSRIKSDPDLATIIEYPGLGICKLG